MHATNNLCAQLADWWLRRNPTYLASAALMAVGARLYLASPDVDAGDFRHILLTLAALQGYVIAVSGCAVVLHHWRRGGSDLVWLLVVGAAFWTGPLAATLELTQYDRTIGLLLSLAAAVVALLELHAVLRWLALPVTIATMLVAPLALALLVAAPAWLHVPYAAAGTNELAIYALWWILAAITLLAALAVHEHEPAVRSSPPQRVPRRLAGELLFLAAVVVATAFHLYGMHYSFFGHARPFYAVPVLAAGIVTLIELARVCAVPVLRGLCLAAVTLLPMIALASAWAGFDSRVPSEALLEPLRDPRRPLLAMSLLVALWAAWRLRCFPLVHVAAATLVALFVISGAAPAGVEQALQHVRRARLPLSPSLVAALYAVAAYFLLFGALRRCRHDFAAGVFMSALATCGLLLGRTPFDLWLAAVLAAWTWLALVHTLFRWPPLSLRAAGVAALLLVFCWAESDPQTQSIGRLHLAACVAVLVGLALLARDRAYALLAGGLAAGGIAFAFSRGLWLSRNPLAGVAVVGAFVLLAIAMLVSWEKERLLAALSRAARRNAAQEAPDA